MAPKHNLSKDDIQKKLGNGGIVVIKGSELNNIFVRANDEMPVSKLIFEKSEGALALENFKNIKEIVIKNCSDGFDLTITDCYVDQFSIIDSHLTAMTLQGNSRVEKLTIEGEKGKNNCRIKTLAILNSDITNIDIKNANLYYTEGDSNPSFLIRNSSIGKIDIENVGFEGSGLFANFLIENTDIKGFINLGNGIKIPRIRFFCRDTTKVINKIILQENKRGGSEKTNIEKIEISGYKITLLKAKPTDCYHIENISISRKSSIDRLNILLDHEGSPVKKSARGYIGTISLEDVEIGDMLCNGFDVKEVYSIKNSKINSGYIHDINILNNLLFERSFENNSLLIIEKTKTKKLTFLNFNNSGNFRFIDLDVGINTRKKEESSPAISIKNSDLGNMHFYNCNLGHPDDYIEFSGSHLLNITVLGHPFPYKISRDTTRNYQIRQQTLLLSQLQKVFEKSNYPVHSVRYHALMLDSIRKEKKLSKQYFDLIPLYLNRFSSFYGDRLLQATLSTLLVCGAFYVCYVGTRGYIDVSKPFSRDTFWYLVANFPEFLSPVRRTNYLPDAKDYFSNDIYGNTLTEKLAGLTIFVSGVSRILTAYFLYQFIQAFRKYGRKN